MDIQIKHILLLDDDELNNLLVKEVILDLISVKEIKTITSGWDALDYLEERKEANDFPDFIIVDVKMPEMDGFEFLEKYEDLYYKDFKNTKVAVATSSQREFDKMKATQYPSVNLFVNKPLDETKLNYTFKALFTS